jgi:hypothetical protein
MPANLITVAHVAVSSALPFGDTSALIDELHVEGSVIEEATPFAAPVHSRLWHEAADSECPLFGR